MDERDIRSALAMPPRSRSLALLIAAAATVATVAVPPHVPIGALFFLVLPLVGLQRSRAARVILAGLGDRELDVRFEFTPDEVVVSRPAGESRSEWSLYRHFTEVPSAFLLYTNALVFHIVPKRAFDAGDLPRLRALLAARLTPPPPRRVGWKRIVGLWSLLVILFVVIWQLVGKDAGRAPPQHPSPATEEP